MTAAEFWAYVMPAETAPGDDLVNLRTALLVALSAAGIATAVWNKTLP